MRLDKAVHRRWELSSCMKHKDYALEPRDPIKAHWEWLPACDPALRKLRQKIPGRFDWLDCWGQIPLDSSEGK